MWRLSLLILAAAAGLVAVATIGFYFYERPTTLRVAVPHGSEYQKLLVILNQEFVRSHEDIRLRIVPTTDETAASKTISEDHADLAVVRSDIPMPTNAATALILAHYSVVIVAPPGKTFANFSELKGRTIGVVETEMSGEANRRLLQTIESQYSIGPGEIKAIGVAPNNLAKFLRGRQIDALFVFGPFDSPQVSGPVKIVSESGAASGAPVFVPILEASALAERFPGLDATQILRGAFGGSPSRPPENISTIGATVRLVARNDLDNSTVGETTRLILADRALAAATVPIANHIEAPSTDKGEVLPTHPGAAAFLDGEEETFFDKYSDMIYIGAMVASVLISGLATLASRLTVSGFARFDQLMEKALTILKSGRKADSLETLAKLEIQIDEILTRSLAAAEMPKLDNHQLAALTLAVQQARLAIADRRSELGGRLPSVRPHDR
ncbi:TAXI family TRAP transporter solute-binding subunit [Candidatus Rhodoblastus alkanivorans]|uniref:ABC transporter substrate-binding protein n=1 Tax=Candidatus Rhodoblastus alkanivorans TaxID=2954117 RepID=A0ABS9Z1P5_9HYPH|nr:TAXI family TRAP transporter solute-binding subunit [Candidatus Rhodoblastus alkanivorans]MCI4681559.1 ABC transporter substrate-binding protein [Candidatus Rhodoblastus alkanivorans]